MTTARSKATSRAEAYSPLGALFANHILALGKHGLAEWLIQSFGQTDPKPQSGWFHYDDDILFSEAFSLVVREFENDVLRTARTAVEEAINAFDPKIGRYLGLLELTALVEDLKIRPGVNKIGEVLDAWVGRNSPKLPHNTTEALALRETLECVYRLLLYSIRNIRTSIPFIQTIEASMLSDFATIFTWADRILIHEHTIRAIVPARAPLYFLAITAAVTRGATIGLESYDARLTAGAYSLCDPFKDLYEFSSDIYPEDKFPYCIDGILRAKQSFLAMLRPDATPPYNASELARDNDPFDEARASATKGILFPAAVDAVQYKEIVEKV